MLLLTWNRSVLSQGAVTRFWSHVEKTSDCWLWISAKNKKGYGVFSVKNSHSGKWQSRLAHRISWIIEHGEIAGSLQVLHRCDVVGCVNPSHLFSGTNYDNRMDSVIKHRHAVGDRCGARTHPERVPRGESNGVSKLTDHQVIEIRALSAAGKTSSEIAAGYPVDRRTIRNIVHGDTWRHIL